MDVAEDLDALVARAQSGDAAAMDELLVAIGPRVFRRCSRFLPHVLDAEEATQDTLLTVATRLNDFSGRGSFLGWVTVIASNASRQTYRTLKRRFDENAVAVLPETVDPRTTSVIAGSRIDLLDAIEALGIRHPETVEAFVLRDLGSLSYEEIAEQTGSPLGTVKARIHTARGFVRDVWGIRDNF